MPKELRDMEVADHVDQATNIFENAPLLAFNSFEKSIFHLLLALIGQMDKLNELSSGIKDRLDLHPMYQITKKGVEEILRRIVPLVVPTDKETAGYDIEIPVDDIVDSTRSHIGPGEMVRSEAGGEYFIRTPEQTINIDSLFNTLLGHKVAIGVRDYGLVERTTRDDAGHDTASE